MLIMKIPTPAEKHEGFSAQFITTFIHNKRAAEKKIDFETAHGRHSLQWRPCCFPVLSTDCSIQIPQRAPVFRAGPEEDLSFDQPVIWIV